MRNFESINLFELFFRTLNIFLEQILLASRWEEYIQEKKSREAAKTTLFIIYLGN